MNTNKLMKIIEYIIIVFCIINIGLAISSNNVSLPAFLFSQLIIILDSIIILLSYKGE